MAVPLKGPLSKGFFYLRMQARLDVSEVNDGIFIDFRTALASPAKSIYRDFAKRLCHIHNT
ncbi:hypothetical protein BJP41_04305 [Candidatus Williamhamiltonella defendens]|uniref:Uncharacterized protein n=1 Tax=Candidatus Williamhamiltonella defendens TaxID=138072 RepID=A0A2D3T790_9ENTR|nr:hypothetical protein BJP41_04305 [Candidatus Hamiltonella defensa]ATW31675.1 hypothetical protein BJP42_04385 [Candidatus Hamiltonella defensa]AWK16270.1 hypothetical protein CCS40_03630 [Candidatus Hamiltonella defensa]